MQSWLKSLMIYLILPILSVLAIDGMAHFFLTSPMETYFYFFIKAVIISLMFFIIFTFKENLNINYALFFSLIFYAIFSLYYRIYEIIYDYPFFARTPSVDFFETFFLKGIFEFFFWLIIHGLTFFIPFIIAVKIKESDY